MKTLKTCAVINMALGVCMCWVAGQAQAAVNVSNYSWLQLKPAKIISFVGGSNANGMEPTKFGNYQFPRWSTRCWIPTTNLNNNAASDYWSGLEFDKDALDVLHLVFGRHHVAIHARLRGVAQVRRRPGDVYHEKARPDAHPQRQETGQPPTARNEPQREDFAEKSPYAGRHRVDLRGSERNLKTESRNWKAESRRGHAAIRTVRCPRRRGNSFGVR